MGRKANPVAAIETITPEKAQALLGRNFENRRLSPARVQQFAGAMERGEWQENGESIKIDEHGNVIDGQHRLAAIVLAGAPVRLLVVRGLPRETQATIDQGRARSLSDHLHMKGIAYAPGVAGALRDVWHYERGEFSRMKGGSPDSPTLVQLLSLFERHPRLADIAKITASLRTSGNRLIPHGPTTALYYLFTSIDEEEGEWFMARLHDGVGLSADQPVYLLRDQLLRNQTSRDKYAARTLRAMTIKAWNYQMTGHQAQHIAWRSSGSRAEEFPTPWGVELISWIREPINSEV